MKKRKGFAIVVVIFFAFAISIFMSTMISSNSSLTNQTKMTIYQMQASYLAQSCLQFAKLHIYLLPKEVYNYYQNNMNDSSKVYALDSVNSGNYLRLDLSNSVKNDYDLFISGKCAPEDFPYSGDFKVDKLKYMLSNDNMKMVQDSYHISVTASIWHGNKGKGREFTETIEEDFIVSRFAGR